MSKPEQDLTEMRPKPLVSVITAVRNGARTLREAMESVLSQDYPHIEYIVIDGGSTDGTQEIVKSYGERIAYFISEKDSGISDAWNKGVRAARGDYIAFLNADDLYQPSFIRRSVAALAGADLEIVYGSTVVITEEGDTEAVLPARFVRSKVALGFGLRHPACLTSRALFEVAGMFDEGVRIACDTDFLLRCVKAGAVFTQSSGVLMMRRGGISDQQWRRAAHEYISRLEVHGFLDANGVKHQRRLVPLRYFNRQLRVMPMLRHFKTQTYFLGLAFLNRLHGCLPYFVRPILYRLCRYEVSPSATLQGGVRFFHVGRLQVGADSVVNRGAYLDNRSGIRIGSHVSVAHDVKIYSLGHEIHDDLFGAKGRPVEIGDHAVLFAGAMVMPGVKVGEGAVVLAGAVVTRDVAPFRVVGGNPAADLGPRDSHPVYQLKRRFWFAH